jgi:hypothetical protein
MIKEKCEFCGKIFYEYELESTSAHGYFCKNCLEICINLDSEAIEAIEERIIQIKRKQNQAD